MKANLKDLNDILFEQVERLNEDDLKGEELETQLKKAKAIKEVASTIICNSALIMNAAKLYSANEIDKSVDVKKMIGYNV